jgi:flagellar transcriptional activator FlhC
MRIKSIVSESRQIQRAISLIKLGARLQVLESETDLSYERLLRLYKEVQGESPARGMLPFSTDWFMTWQPNIHSSLFLNMYEYLDKTSELEEIDAIIKAYELYLEQIRAQGLEPLLSVTRAWRLVKFVDAGMVTLTSVLQVRRQVRHAHVRADQELRLRPVRASSTRRQRQSAGASCAPKTRFTDYLTPPGNRWCQWPPRATGSDTSGMGFLRFRPVSRADFFWGAAHVRDRLAGRTCARGG